MTMENDVKIEEELTCQFKSSMRNLKNCYRELKKSINCTLINGLLLTKVFNVCAKESTEELCLKIDAKFEGKLTSAF